MRDLDPGHDWLYSADGEEWFSIGSRPMPPPGKWFLKCANCGAIDSTRDESPEEINYRWRSMGRCATNDSRADFEATTRAVVRGAP